MMPFNSFGGFVFHDVTDNRFANKAVEKGADGLPDRSVDRQL